MSDNKIKPFVFNVREEVTKSVQVFADNWTEAEAILKRDFPKLISACRLDSRWEYLRAYLNTSHLRLKSVDEYNKLQDESQKVIVITKQQPEFWDATVKTDLSPELAFSWLDKGYKLWLFTPGSKIPQEVKIVSRPALNRAL